MNEEQHEGMKMTKAIVSVDLDNYLRQWPNPTWTQTEYIAHRLVEELNDRGVDFTTVHMH